MDCFQHMGLHLDMGTTDIVGSPRPVQCLQNKWHNGGSLRAGPGAVLLLVSCVGRSSWLLVLLMAIIPLLSHGQNRQFSFAVCQEQSRFTLLKCPSHVTFTSGIRDFHSGTDLHVGWD